MPKDTDYSFFLYILKKEEITYFQDTKKNTDNSNKTAYSNP